MNALVIDDSRAMRMILGRMLRELGMEVAEAANGRLALDLLDEGSIRASCSWTGTCRR